MSRIRVTIDRVVFKGIEPAERAALVDALRLELARVLADRSARAEWARPHRTPVLKLGRMPLQGGPSGGRSFGSGLARAIARGLSSAKEVR
jgi:hypothetical protein